MRSHSGLSLQMSFSSAVSIPLADKRVSAMPLRVYFFPLCSTHTACFLQYNFAVATVRGHSSP